ncbi:DNA-binding transcriptional regulator Fis [Coxiella endosymbiont of Amblyomma nuttalli]|uniref:DNA-binding transcriptional regulator Fis n=1 Tax=Coxiella endosymbiont of Amblyomma nuttalli TaxID=2749996 RepID=UPI001BABD3BB|nr:DNA-binding transcriptional regulator Fis [Coxiella endosymbiont of Amblyomma nuttalli]QTS84032.1 DNA-binding protein Fis [Coxiella endosymbiont of Amblyomma nuttalli]
MLVQEPEVRPINTSQFFASSVQQSLQNYFAQLDGEDPANLYNMILAEMELSLLKVVIRHTNGNQSKAAKLLGINRGTLRKKLAIYQIYEPRR